MLLGLCPHTDQLAKLHWLQVFVKHLEAPLGRKCVDLVMIESKKRAETIHSLGREGQKLIVNSLLPPHAFVWPSQALGGLLRFLLKYRFLSDHVQK